MRLHTPNIRSRAFLLQFFAIMEEFGHEIPWLDGMGELRFATNADHFCNEIAKRTNQGDKKITPYQFIEDGDARTFVGGMLHFPKSPEVFRDTLNSAASEHLTSAGASFISCLQVRQPHQHHAVGRRMFRRTLDTILQEKGSIWGVISDPRLRTWYQSFNGHIWSPDDNKDNLWIVSWGIQ